jgi:hypothetical protein
MRLSEDRIGAIAEKIAFNLVKKRMVVTKLRLAQVAAWIEKPILEDLKREEAIDREVAEYIRGLSKRPPEGSFEYNALFEKKKEEIARRRDFTI